MFINILSAGVNGTNGTCNIKYNKKFELAIIVVKQ